MPVYTGVVYQVQIIPYFRLAREFAKDGEHTYTDKLKRIQCILMDISASILKSSKPEQQVHLSTRHTKDLEEWIEEYSRQLPPLEKYVIPVSLFISLVLM
jgi:cob(I)alamin adenosyltransferase